MRECASARLLRRAIPRRAAPCCTAPHRAPRRCSMQWGAVQHCGAVRCGARRCRVVVYSQCGVVRWGV
eukprot:12707132-Alexandrium_andersonii.AAC.1